jgi:hypothetical protein
MTARPESDHYEIRLEGRLPPSWADWFEGFTLTPGSDGTTTLTGGAIDQAALHGLLRRVSDLGVTLISVNSIHPSHLSPRPSTPRSTRP